MATNKTISSCRNSDVAPSNTRLSEHHLINLKLMEQKKNVELNAPTDVAEVWQKILSSVGNGSFGPNVNLNSIADVLIREHEYEEDFDNELFNALQACLSGQGLLEVTEYPTEDRTDTEDPMDTEDQTDLSAVVPIAASAVPNAASAVPNAARALPNAARVRSNAASDARGSPAPAKWGAKLLQVFSPRANKGKRTQDTEKKFKTERNVDVKEAIPEAKNLFPAQSTKGKAALEPIVFSHGLDYTEYPMYAIGISRQANGKQCSSSTPDGRSSSRSDSTTSGVAANSKLDHCSCLLERTVKGGKWNVLRTFSVVELKALVDNDCVSLSVSETNVQKMDIASAHGAIAQALLYTMAWALPSHAEIKELEDLSWAAIIGKKKPRAAGNIGKANILQGREVDNEDENAENDAWEDEDAVIADDGNSSKVKAMPPNKYRWVAGKIYVPQKCGGLYQYAATSFGLLLNNGNIASVYNAISAYLETLLFGIGAAKVLLELLNSKAVFTSFPTTGKQGMLGNVELPNLRLQGKPKKPIREDPNDRAWTISQGEIFSGQIDFGQLKIHLRPTPLVYLFNENDVSVDVVVKVSSMSVHRYLNPSSDAWVAMGVINTFFQNESRKRKKSGDTSGENKLDMFNVLLAVEFLPDGLITVMADLSKDYGDMTPRQDNLSFDRVWVAFLCLLQRILIPLADLQLIHPDIRPGWDITSNILLLKKDGRDHGKKPAMQIIDFESLVVSSIWSPPEPKQNEPNFKYIPHERGWSSYTFLWWQCVTLAYAWHEKVSQRKMEEVNLKQILLDKEHPFSSKLGKSICADVNNVHWEKDDFLNSIKQLNISIFEIRNGSEMSF